MVPAQRGRESHCADIVGPRDAGTIEEPRVRGRAGVYDDEFEGRAFGSFD